MMADDNRVPAAARQAHGPLAPGSRIAILGGGQLGRMLAMSAARLGFHCTIYSDADNNPAFEVADRAIRGSYGDFDALSQMARTCDVLTYEFENVPVAPARHLASSIAVRPCSRALEISQDRLAEKRFLESCGLPVGPYRAVSDANELASALAELNAPALLKTRRFGYDGKGQIAIEPGDDCEAAIAAIGAAPAVLEKRLAFDCELSVIAVRGVGGDTAFYDCPRNVHKSGILRVSTVPSGLGADIGAQAQRFARTVLEALDYVGVVAVELFFLGADAPQPLLINEIAPRVHNSGHWTQDVCVCDQFENHIRAIAGWPLGPTGRFADVEMHNLIGSEVAQALDIAADPSAVLHLYGKTDARPGRKMGHLNKIVARPAP